MLINFFDYVINFGSLVWNFIIKFGESIFTLGTNALNKDIFEYFRDFSTTWGDMLVNSPFNEVIKDFGGFPHDLMLVLNVIINSFNLAIGAVMSVLNGILSLVGLSIPANNIIIILTYFICSFGVIIMVLAVIRYLIRLFKDLFNPIN